MLKRIGPQAGAQEAFLSSSADIAIYGGAAGGGKSFGLLLEPVRHINVPKFYAVIFRKTYPEIMNVGGLWDGSYEIYPHCNGVPKLGSLSWVWKSQARVEFSHFNHRKCKLDWQGGQICMEGWDELTHFPEDVFFYMLSRNRSTCGVRPYVRATCNPDPDSWVKTFIAWWLDEDTGYPIPERAGLIRWFVRHRGEILWGDTISELPSSLQKYAKSATFIPARLEDNQILVSADPDYVGQLMSLPHHELERLRYGNWNVRAVAGNYFRREYFEVIDTLPKTGRSVRYWDLASTEESESNKDPDWTVGLKLTELAEGGWCVEDVRRGRWSPRNLKNVIKRTAQQDGTGVQIFIEQEPGSSGKIVTSDIKLMLAGYSVKGDPQDKKKEIRAGPVSSQAESGNIVLLRGSWNDTFLSELEAFPTVGIHDDQPDALSGAFNRMTLSRTKVGVRGTS